MNLFTFGIGFALLGVASCDYKCICNYNVEKSVQSAPSVQSNVLGYMYEFDCKPQAGASTDDKWLKVAYEHQLGYVEKDSQLQIQTCPGAVPDEDKLPTTTVAQTTVAQTTFVASTTPVPTTTTVISSTPKATTTKTQTTTVPTTPVVTTRETTTTTRPTTTPSTTLASTTTLTSTPVPTTSTLSTTTTQRPTTTTATRVTKRATSASTTTRPTPSTITYKPSITQMSTLQTTTTTRTTTTTKQMTTQKPATLQGHIELCPNRIQHLAKQPGELIAQLGKSCYEIVQAAVSWSHADSNCKSNGGHLIHIANQQEQDFINNFLVKHHSHGVWLGLHDRNQEENFEWTSGNSITYTNWKPGRKDYRYHNSEDCVYMSPSTGQWDDVQCGGDTAFSELFHTRHAYICQYATVDATVSDGNVNMCSYNLHRQAERDRGVLGQYDHSCYEIVPNAKVAWQHAEDICHSRGGHLAYISSLQEQAFIEEFLNRYSPSHAVWIGLTDHDSEGHFRWTSGAPVQFTNWIPGHLSNYASSSQEDCVALIPYKSGQWDDIPCGSTHHSIFGGTSSFGEIHPLLCQYRISSGPSLIG